MSSQQEIARAIVCESEASPPFRVLRCSGLMHDVSVLRFSESSQVGIYLRPAASCPHTST